VNTSQVENTEKMSQRRREEPAERERDKEEAVGRKDSIKSKYSKMSEADLYGFSCPRQATGVPSLAYCCSYYSFSRQL
jgi:hypothetical protein